MHVGNLGFKTPYGYFGAGTFESPYKTMGQFDNNMDTAIALNAHGGTSQGNSGIAGNVESMIAYSVTAGPATFAYMVAVSDSRGSNDNTNTDQIQLEYSTTSVFVLVHGLGFILQSVFMTWLTVTHIEANIVILALIILFPTSVYFVNKLQSSFDEYTRTILK